MKRFLCGVISIALLLCLFGCNNNSSYDYSSAEIEIIYQEEIVDSDDNNTTTSNTSFSQNVDGASQSSASDTVETSKPDTPLPTDEPQENIYYLNDADTLKNIKLNGRCEKTSDGIGLNFAASAIEFNTDSSSAMLEVTAKAGVYYSVFVDGKLTEERAVTESGTNYIILARGLSEGSHNIKFVRATEGRGGNLLTAVSIQFDEGRSVVSGSAQSDVLIEFLGDSLTSGYGNLTTSVVEKASDLKYQNSLKAYPYLIAEKLGFDYRIVSMSGIALKERTDNNNNRYPAFYDFYCLENYYKDKTQKYTSSNPQDVDIVVVNLGTNDVSKGLFDTDDAAQVEEYSRLYAELITNIGYRTDAKIVFVSGVGWCHTQKGAYDAAKAKLNTLGYNNVYVYDCLTYNSGGENHPSENEHQEAADAIIKFFKDNGISQ
ncbi:MAG: hypothetical protein IJY79_08415 [Clostridia bacterium]|nr:hypothetical protein [Clostridia bacterium]